MHIGAPTPCHIQPHQCLGTTQQEPAFAEAFASCAAPEGPAPCLPIAAPLVAPGDPEALRNAAANDLSLALVQEPEISGPDGHENIPPNWGVIELTRGWNPIADEAVYLAYNPDVSEAVEIGIFSSAQEHFAMHGQDEGRAYGRDLFAMHSAASANYFLANPDVLDGVRAGGLRTAREHFETFGAAEGRAWNMPTLETVRSILSPAGG